VLRSLDHPNVLRFIGVLYKDKRLSLVTGLSASLTFYTKLVSFTISEVYRQDAPAAEG